MQTPLHFEKYAQSTMQLRIARTFSHLAEAEDMSLVSISHFPIWKVRALSYWTRWPEMRVLHPNALRALRERRLKYKKFIIKKLDASKRNLPLTAPCARRQDPP